MGSSILIVTILVSLLEGFNIGLLVPLLETVNSTNPTEEHWVSGAIRGLFDSLGLAFGLGPILLGLSVLMLVAAAAKYSRLLLVTRAGIGFVVWLRSRYMGNLLKADMSFHHGQQIGVHTDTLSIQITRSAASLTQTTDLIASFGIVLTYLTVALMIAPLLTGVALVIIILVSVGMQRYISKARRLGTERVVLENEYQASAVETLSAVHLIKSFMLESMQLTRFSDKSKDVGEADYRLSKNTNQMLVFQELGLFAVVGGIVYVGVSALALDITVIVALLFTLYRMMPRVTSINASRQAVAISLATLDAVEATVGDVTSPTIINGERSFSRLNNEIEFNNVRFGYEEDIPVLTGASFTIEKGKMTAIVGASGAGKSTIIDMLLRFYDPVSGRVIVDGVDLKELDLHDWRRSIGLVSQDVFLFNDTLGHNISLGREGVTQAQIEQAANQAYAHEFILRLPNAYETTVGDRGWNLSGGQRQRIALARAILLQPEILLLDEATSSLDSESEKLMQQYLNSMRNRSTMVVVAHRLSTIQDADKIVVLENGAVVEQGDWDGLLADSGVLANFHKLQVGASPDSEKQSI